MLLARGADSETIRTEMIRMLSGPGTASARFDRVDPPAGLSVNVSTEGAPQLVETVRQEMAAELRDRERQFFNQARELEEHWREHALVELRNALGLQGESSETG